MTEATETTTEEVNEPQESVEQVWERTMQTQEPITKEDLRGEAAEEKEEVLPDRALVAPEIVQFLKEKEQPTQDPALAEVQALRDRLEELARPKEEDPSELQQLLAKVDMLEQRDRERMEEAQRREAEEAREARLRTFREGVVGNIRAQEGQYPALIALSLEGNVFDTFFTDQQQTQPKFSDEYEVASQAEKELWDMYDALHEIKAKTTSKEPEPSKAPVTQTLTPNLTAQDEPELSVDELIQKFGKQKAMEMTWEGGS